ncbi:sulfatase-like hydrolase/transferase [Paracoccus sp. PARArs4]|uniref:sulfatase-like hydrolase/transferase n=1 Tax=Paracoccus sp. PARArs4 TaxID=2853442 RepID=UPI0024A6BF06|nr:sulfatase-like hydrolase/transferase [Paracoccus sp. PARArs4]
MIRRAAPLLISALLLHAIAALPSSPGAMRIDAWLRPAPELLVLLLMLVLLGDRAASRALRMAATVTIGVLSILKLADIAIQMALGRRFNLVADIPLIDASVRLIAGAVGRIGAVLLVVAAILAAFAIFRSLWWALGRWSRAGVPAAIPVIALAGLTLAMNPAPMLWNYGAGQIRTARATTTELAKFREAAAQDDAARIDQPFGLIDRDVIVVFIESYGRASFDVPRYAATHVPILRDAAADLDRAGLAMRSGFLTSPTHGGQSWLAHATFANGLRIEGQTRYRAALASGRQTLFHIAQDAGLRTAAVMPAITRPWPEAREMGFDTVLDAKALDYRGLPFNWVTMPDQFTLAAMDRKLRGSDDAPLLAQVALISSHAPWTPIPSMIPWDQVADGREFDEMARSGDTPKTVWRDRERVREQYGKSIDYALRAVTEYAALRAEDPPLLVLVGDHQAASSIGLDERHEVPIHVIGPDHLVRRTAEWGLTPGLIPEAGSPAIPMEEMRMNILRSFSGDAGRPRS